MSQDQGGEARRDAIVAFVRGFQSDHGYAPSYRQITEGVGMRSVAAVHTHVHRLVAQGRLQLEPGHPRSVVAPEVHSLPDQLEALLELVDDALDSLRGYADDWEADSSRWTELNETDPSSWRAGKAETFWHCAGDLRKLIAEMTHAEAVDAARRALEGCPGHAADVDRGPHAGSRSSSRGGGATPTAGPDDR